MLVMDVTTGMWETQYLDDMFEILVIVILHLKGHYQNEHLTFITDSATNILKVINKNSTT